MMHTLHLERTNAHGQELWACPICNRRILLAWSPRYEKRVLRDGDRTACHSGGKGGR